MIYLIDLIYLFELRRIPAHTHTLPLKRKSTMSPTRNSGGYATVSVETMPFLKIGNLRSRGQYLNSFF